MYFSRRQPVPPYLHCLHGTLDQDPSRYKAGYTLGDVKINHLFFMDDLKVYGKDKAKIESLISTVQLISQDIGIEYGIKKCGVVVLKRGKCVKVRVLSR